MKGFHLHDQLPYWITETNESIYIKIEVSSRRISLVHQHGCRGVKWKTLNTFTKLPSLSNQLKGARSRYFEVILFDFVNYEL